MFVESLGIGFENTLVMVEAVVGSYWTFGLHVFGDGEDAGHRFGVSEVLRGLGNNGRVS